MSDAFREWAVERPTREFFCPRCRVEMLDPDEAESCEDPCCPCALMADEWRREHGDEP